VCDCGGGTVDITTYNIVDVSPRLEFDEICVGVGESADFAGMMHFAHVSQAGSAARRTLIETCIVLCSHDLARPSMR